MKWGIIIRGTTKEFRNTSKDKKIRFFFKKKTYIRVFLNFFWSFEVFLIFFSSPFFWWGGGFWVKFFFFSDSAGVCLFVAWFWSFVEGDGSSLIRNGHCLRAVFLKE